MSYRYAETADRRKAFELLLQLKEKRAGDKQMKFTDPDAAHRYLQYCKAVVVDEAYFIMFDVGSPWYSNEKFLIEDLILKINHTDTPVEVAIDALSDLARDYGCIAITAGDTQIGYMAPKYLASGFVTLGTQLIKEV